MPSDAVSHRCITGAFYDKSLYLPLHKRFDLMTVLAVYLVLLYRLKALPIITFLFLYDNNIIIKGTGKTNTSEVKKHWFVLLITVLIFFISVLLYELLSQCGDIESNPGPGTDEEHISIVHYNVQSILPKIDVLFTELNTIDVLAFTETWLNPVSESSPDLIHNDFYPPFCQSRQARIGGGVAIYVRKNFVVKRRKDLEVRNIESVWLELKLKSQKLLLGTFYRPPNTNNQYWNLIQLSIELAFNTGIANILITGDLNDNVLAVNNCGLTDIMNQFDLKQLIDEPTHYTETSTSILDVFLVNNDDIVEHSSVGDPFLTSNIRYHCPIYAYLKFKRQSNYTSTKRRIWLYKDCDFNIYRDKLSNVAWAVADAMSVELNTEYVTNALTKIASETIPNKEITLRKNDPPWMHNNIRRLIRTRKRIHYKAKMSQNPYHWETFRKVRNNCVDAIRKAKQNYLNKIASQLHTSPVSTRSWWKVLNSLTKFSCKTTDIPIIISNGIEYTDDIDKATFLNDYFIQQTELNDSQHTLPVNIDNHTTVLDNIDITEQDVSDAISTLDTSKASGPDLINGKLLKEGKHQLAGPLCKLFNKSLQNQSYPETWKLANVIPIFKKDDPSAVSNYRPISLISIMGKVMEKCIYKYVYNFLRDKSFFTEHQSGFRSGDSAINQLLTITNDIGKALDSGKEVQVIFLDISKAFDRVWHKGLLYKLKKAGVTGTLLGWFDSYLSDRKQRVMVNGKFSNYKSIKAGVPQGSILGPLLFLIFINDIISDINSIIKLFADDTTIYLVIDNAITSANIINNDLFKIHTWANQWLVTFNANKTESLLVSKKSTKSVLPRLSMNNTTIQQVTTHKHLGVYINSELSWTTHVESVITQASRRLAVLRKHKFLLDRRTLEQIYFSYILPVLEYADIVWDSLPIFFINKLELIHKEAARIVTGATKLVSTDLLYKDTCWETLEERRKKHKIIKLHSMVHNHTPSAFSGILPRRNSEIHNVVTRQSNQLSTIKTNTNYYKNSFLPASVSLWNNLPSVIRENSSLSVLKNYLNRDITKPPSYRFCGNRLAQIYHTRLRLQCSSLKAHLYDKNLTDDPFCTCGYIEDNFHFLFACEKYTYLRDQYIWTLNYDLNTDYLLWGNPDLTEQQNEEIVFAVHEFIIKSKRFV